MSNPPNLKYIDPGAPFSQEAEEATLGSILIDPSKFDAIRLFLRDSSFFLLRHQYIWQGLQRLHNRAEAIDPISLGEDLENQGVLENIGGRAYLVQLLNNTGTSVYAEVYARLVERTAIRRALMVAADELKKVAQDESLDIDRVMIGVHNILDIQGPLGRVSFGIYEDLSQYYDAVETRVQQRLQGKSIGIPTGLRDVDSFTGGLRKGEVFTLAGATGMGKTAAALSLTRNTLILGQRVGYISLEMTAEMVLDRLTSQQAQVNLTSLRNGTLTPLEANRFTTAVGNMNKWQLSIFDRRKIKHFKSESKIGQVTIEDVGRIAESMKHETGLDLLVIDHCHLLDTEDRYGSEMQRYATISGKIVGIAKELNIPILALWQLNRAPSGRQDKRPQLSDLKYTGNIENDSDVVVLLYRDEYYNTATTMPNQIDFIFAKMRNGPTTTIPLHYKAAYTQVRQGTLTHVDLGDDAPIRQAAVPNITTGEATGTLRQAIDPT